MRCFARAARVIAVLAVSAPLEPAGRADCGVGALAAAIFNDAAGSCDVNGDGIVSAADVTAAVLALVPTPSPTDSPTPSPTTPPTPEVSGTPAATPTTTAEGSPTPTPSVTLSAGTSTPTPTQRPCPTSGADLVVEIDNQTGVSPISVEFTGQRVGDECLAGVLNASYSLTLDCHGTGTVSCGQVNALAPGTWRHSIHVVTPRTGQRQHRASLLVTGSPANRLRYTAFASVLTVQTTANAGDGALRQVLQNADASPKPLLIQFDPKAFPAGVPTTILLEFQLPALTANDVTIDGTDGTGATGNRIIDADGLPIGALAITGARNHIIGLRLRNAGANDRDVLSISGPMADGNVIERTVIESAATGDGVGVDQNAGKDFGDTVNVIRDCEIFGAADKGVKVTTEAYAHVERCWVHDNANGGIQATLGGHVRAWHNVVERNRGGTAQNGLSVNALDDSSMTTGFSELRSWGDISRGNGANGLSVRAFAVAEVRDDYLATNGSSGLRVFNDVGPPATAAVEGTSVVCNAVDGAVVANNSAADFGGGPLGSAGHNGFTQNNLPAGGANLRNATSLPVSAINSQWEHCGRDIICNDAAIAAFDLSDHGANTTFVPAQAHRSQKLPVLATVAPAKGTQGELLRIFGSGFNVIDGHFAEDNCADVTGRNRCVPLRGNCVRINGVSAPVEAVTPTMLVVRWPFTCIAPVPLIVTTDQGATGATSVPITVCTNDAGE